MTGLLPRTLRLDASDTVVFAAAAAPGQWAVTGTFLFAGRDPAAMGRKERIAFRAGFLGVADFGFSTLVEMAPAGPAERAAAVEALAAALLARLGAPGLAEARAAAEEEVAFAADLCRGHEAGTVAALHRSHDADGAIRERFRTLKPRDRGAPGPLGLSGHARAFDVVETDDAGETPPVDLVALLKDRAAGRGRTSGR